MKKGIKKSIACLIAVLMIVSSLPFSALTAQAATSTNSISQAYEGTMVITTTDNNRYVSKQLTIVNDRQQGNIDIGYVSFDISGLDILDNDTVTANYNFTDIIDNTSGNRESCGLSVLYPTKNIDSNSFLTTGNHAFSGVTFTSSNSEYTNFISEVKSHYGLQLLTSFAKITSLQNQKYENTRTVDIGPAIKAAKLAGQNYATICFLLTEMGGAGGAPWSDELVKITQSSVDVNVTESDQSVSKTINITNGNYYGILRSTYGNSRFSDPTMTIVNDAQNSNFDIGYVTFDVSSLRGTKRIMSKAEYSFDLSKADWTEDLGFKIYYPTKDTLTVFQNTGELTTGDKSAIWTGDSKDSVSDHIGKAIDYFGLKEIASYDTVAANVGTVKVDISEALQWAVDNNKNNATICIMLAKQGGIGQLNLSGGTDKGWSDTYVKVTNKSLTATIKTATGYDLFNTVKSQAKSFTAYSPSAHGSFSGDADYTNYSDHYKGLVYAENVTDYSATGSVGLGSNWLGSNTTYANLYFPTSVALYTGSNEITVPIMISASTAQSGTWSCKFKAHSGVISGTGLSLVNSNWNGKDEKDSGSENYYTNGSQTSHLPALNFMWTINQTSYLMSTNATTSPTNSVIDPGKGTKAEIWANKVKVTPSFSNNSKVTTLSYTPQIKFYVTVDSNSTIDTGKYITLNSSDSVTVVNYKVYLDKLSQIKSDISSLQAENYSEESIKAYANACKTFLAIDPTSYSYSGTTSYAVNSLVTDINNAITAYDTAKNNLVRMYNYIFVNKDGTKTTLKAQTYSAALIGAQSGRVPQTSQSSTTYKGENKHHYYTYSWPTAIENETQDCEITEIETEHTENCTVGTDGNCTVCKQKLIDYSAYDSTVAESENIKNDSQYKDTSRQQYTELVDSAKITKDSTATQDKVNTATAKILAAKSVLRKNSCIITVRKVIGAEDSDVTTITKEYGTSEDIDIVELTKNDETPVKGVEKWTITTDDGKTITKLDTLDISVTLYVTKDVTITAYASDEASDSTSSKVVFLGINGRVVKVEYLAKGAKAYDTSNVPAPAVPFYTFTKWDTDSVTADGSGKTIYVRAEYSCTSTDDMCTVHFNGKTKDYSYDSYVRPEGIDPTKQYALSSDGTQEHILTYLKGVDFYAPKTKNIYVIEVSSREAKIGITGSFSQRITEDGKNKRTATFNCKFYLPEDCTLVEWGAEISANGRTQVVKGESISSGNEYSITMKTTSSSLTAFTGVAYVTYKIGDQTVTIKSDSVEQKLVD